MLLDDSTLIKSIEEILILANLNVLNFNVSFIKSLLKLISNLSASPGIIINDIVTNSQILKQISILNSNFKDNIIVKLAF